MNKLEVFEPAMCCSTGVCGPSVDEDVLLITSVVNSLNTVEGYEAVRYNLSDSPQEFVNNTAVSQILQEQFATALPMTLVNGEVKKPGAYPTLDEIAEYTGVRFMVTESTDGGCCGGSGCC